MGVGEALVLSTALQAGSSIYAGIEANKVGGQQKKLYDKQAAIAISEAKDEAGRLRLRNKIDNARVKLQFLHQGVAISGSPANILATDINLQDKEVRAVLDRGVAQSQILSLQGQIAKNEGRAQLISGIIGGISSGVSTFATAKFLGFFNSGNIAPNSSSGITSKTIGNTRIVQKGSVTGKFTGFGDPFTIAKVEFSP